MCCCFVGQGFGVRVSLIEGSGSDLAPLPVLYQKYNYPYLNSARFGSKKCFFHESLLKRLRLRLVMGFFVIRVLESLYPLWIYWGGLHTEMQPASKTTASQICKKLLNTITLHAVCIYACSPSWLQNKHRTFFFYERKQNGDDAVQEFFWVFLPFAFLMRPASFKTSRRYGNVNECHFI